MATEPKQPGRLIVISGPSGSGKSTLTRIGLERTGLHLSLSATTRQPGPNETDGKDYHFISRQKFEEMIAADEFLEYAQVFDNYYGTPVGPLNKKLAEGQNVILEIDIQGGLQVFKRFPDAQGILILSPDMKELQNRLEKRARDDAETIKKRLAKAEWEIQTAQQSGHYKHILINDNLKKAAEELVDILEGRS
ncbi:MAG: guanylate kinase [Phycisphaerae bacterium]|nr:guanylate kinase [Phycisphaerae bacterium]